ncbi:hypothetical protein Pst134EA_004822 [Puccinia striiformis f. sp. tritici]|uniref:hypothetical protein n=1 Tax=Puccinia striiformis f. sp. tritici TaxID=168172 RepID=UPI0020079A6E|nr:hypothetical protein Pst134EA_004822 [Puccinia striiformis f. sp. tritici]KAH9470911.1 hypothetical protein Pst134EA_004822 [Puccinia striiformis f. sp. tritici]
MLDNVEHLEDYEEAIRRAIDRLYEKLNENLAGETNVLDDDLTERAVYSTDPAKTNEVNRRIVYRIAASLVDSLPIESPLTAKVE